MKATPFDGRQLQVVGDTAWRPGAAAVSEPIEELPHRRNSVTAVAEREWAGETPSPTLFFTGALGAAHGDVEFVEGGDEHRCRGEAVGEGYDKKGFEQVIDQEVGDREERGER